MSQTRMTRQRAVILDALRSVRTHPTADEIYGMVRRKLPRISLGTVYRNLDLLSSSGEIGKLERSGLQKRFDGDITPHRHVRCEVCGKVGDIFSPIPVPELGKDAVPGFSITGVEVEFLGLCDECRVQDNKHWVITGT